MTAEKFTLFRRDEDVVRAPKKRLKKGERSETGGVWYICVLPLLGLVMEMFAVDKYSGAILWLAVLVMIYVGCMADFKSIKSYVTEDEYAMLKKKLPIPPLYIYKRDKIRTGEGYKGLVLAILIAAALFANGFTAGLMLTPEKLQDSVEMTRVDNLENFSGSSNALISEQLEGWFDDGEYEKQASKEDDKYLLVFSGKHDGKPAELTITVMHDGYAYQSIRATRVRIDGKKLYDDEFKEILTEIFIPSDEQPTDEETSAEE